MGVSLFLLFQVRPRQWQWLVLSLRGLFSHGGASAWRRFEQWHPCSRLVVDLRTAAALGVEGGGRRGDSHTFAAPNGYVLTRPRFQWPAHSNSVRRGRGGGGKEGGIHTPIRAMMSLGKLLPAPCTKANLCPAAAANGGRHPVGPYSRYSPRRPGGLSAPSSAWTLTGATCSTPSSRPSSAPPSTDQPIKIHPDPRAAGRARGSSRPPEPLAGAGIDTLDTRQEGGGPLPPVMRN